MLAPAADDPKRKEQLARQKADPASFGTDIPKARADLPKTGGLKEYINPVKKEK